MLNSAEFAGFVDRIADLTNANLDALRLGKQSWAKQFEEALNVNGGDLETATAFSYLLHFMTFGFKVSIVNCIRRQKSLSSVYLLTVLYSYRIRDLIGFVFSL